MPKYVPKRYNQKQDLKQRRKHYYLIENNSNVNHIYYDINVFNNNTGYDKDGNTIPILSSQPCVFNQMRNIPFLDNPSEYDLAIARFNLDSNSFPNQIVQPMIGVPKNIDGSYKTVYTLYLKTPNSPNFETINISWEPADRTLIENPPTTGSELVTKEMLTNEYFYNYSYQYFLDRINKALYESTTCQDSNSYFYFKYDPNTGLISIKGFYYDVDEVDVFGGDVIGMYVNPQLYNLLAGFQYLYYESIGPINTPVYELITTNVYNAMLGGFNSYVYVKTEPLSTDLTTIPPPYNTDNFVTTQSYKSTQLWNPVVSIVFTSKCLSVANDEEAAPYIYGLNPNSQVNNSNVSINLFELSLGRRIDPSINYIDYIYLFKTLLSNEPQKDLNLEIFWKDDYGNLHPFYIESGSNFGLKLLFRKNKDYKYL